MLLMDNFFMFPEDGTADMARYKIAKHTILVMRRSTCLAVHVLLRHRGMH